MKENSKGRSFAPLFVTNFFGVLNDNFLKTLASFVVIGWIADKSLQSVFMGLTAGALVLPYIICSPLADRLTVLFPKRRIVRFAKWAELPIMAMAIAGFSLHSAGIVVASVLLMGLQSSLYSPAKYALVRDIGGTSRISTGMGGMEGVAFLAMLGGTVAASFAVDFVTPAWRYAALFGFAVLGLVFSFTIRADEERNTAIHAISPIRYMARAYRMAKRYPGLNAVIVTLSVFWWAAAMLQMGMLVYGKQVMELDATHTGLILSLAAIGIVAGQVIAGFVDRRHYLLGATLLTGWIAAALLLALFFVPMGPVAFSVCLGLLAFDMGFFKLPLDAEIQKVVKGPRLNTMLAYFNQVSFLFMLAASGVYALVSWAFGPRAFLLVLGLAMLVTPVWFLLRYRTAFSYFGHWIVTRRYAVTTDGMEVFEVEKEGGGGQRNVHPSTVHLDSPPPPSYLILPNHPAMIDPVLVIAELWRIPASPLCDELYFDRGGVSAAFLKMYDAVRVPDLRKHRSADGLAVVRGLNDVVPNALANGKNVIFYPSGHIWTEPEPHDDIGTRQLAHNVCRAIFQPPTLDPQPPTPNVRVIGIRTLGLWGSMWSRKGQTRTPSFGPVFARAVRLWFLCLVTGRRRKVTMHFEDLTDRVREWSQLPRLEFNKKLEDWYNEKGNY